ncbi:hypothetical protein OROMI_032259 [Orobanche minor]
MFLSKLESPAMFGEIGVIFNIPQPFTVKTKRLSEVIRISHNHFKQLVETLSEDGKIIVSNFLQNLKSLKEDELKEMPFVTELLGETNIEATTSTDELQNHDGPSLEAKIEGVVKLSVEAVCDAYLTWVVDRFMRKKCGYKRRWPIAVFDSSSIRVSNHGESFLREIKLIGLASGAKIDDPHCDFTISAGLKHPVVGASSAPDPVTSSTSRAIVVYTRIGRCYHCALLFRPIACRCCNNQWEA